MKVNIVLGTQPLDGYTNLSIFNVPNCEVCDIRNLDSVCDNGELEELRAINVCNFLHLTEMYNVLQHYTSKLAHGGKILVGGNDGFEVAKSLFLGHLNLREYNELVYGSHDNAWMKYSGMYDVNEICGILGSFGLQIEKKRVNGHVFIAEASRG